MTLGVGTEIGDYRILSRIGGGTNGIVFEAEHVITRRVDALKVMDTAGLADDEERFLREIQLQSKLAHPNIAPVYRAFRAPCGLVLAMERVAGESLRTVLDRGPLPLATGLRYIMDTLAGLDFAAQAGVIHRNIRPENIMITPDGGVKVMDFGLGQVVNCARITGAGEPPDMPWYIAPEQVDGKGVVDARTDIYSTGVVLYEVATGRLPFPGTNGFSVACAHLEKEPKPPVELDPELGERLSRVILRAMEKAPSRRFPNAADFRAAIQMAAPEQTVARRGGAQQRIRFPWKWAAVIATVGFGMAVAFIAGGIWNSQKSSPTAPPAAQAAPDASQASTNGQPRKKKAPAGSTARPRAKSAAPDFSNVEGRYVIGQQGETQPPQPAAVETPVAAAAPAAPPPAEAAASPTPAPQSDAAGTDTKKHNVVVRTLGKIFHKNDKPPENGSDRKDQKPAAKKKGAWDW